VPAAARPTLDVVARFLPPRSAADGKADKLNGGEVEPGSASLGIDSKADSILNDTSTTNQQG